ncbi:hypothetical protein GGI07_000199 [Coemansia sp. Benny D115]|nr:hypothetical protein GGI07_000199 [Coemansia sp. Benny D115]
MSSIYEGMSTLKELAERANAPEIEVTARTCLNMSQFKNTLKQLRKVDDNIILRMNGTNTASQEDCLAFFKVLRTAYSRRERDITFCLGVLDQQISQSQTSKLSLVRQRDWVENEKTVEDIVRTRTLDVFKARCQFFEFPSDFVDFLERK